MQFALDKDQNRVLADKAERGQEYVCPICKNEVILKKGDINIPHFAHKTVCEDKWHYDMSEWHYGMQQRFPEEQREVVVTHNGQTHRADILCGKQVIEFQHSDISAEEIEERTTFYIEAGYDIAWVFDVQEQYDNGNIICTDEEYPKANEYRWKYTKKSLQGIPSSPREDNKKTIVYLYWVEQMGIELYESFNKIVKTQRGSEGPDFSLFLTYCEPTIETESLEEKLKVSDFFRTRVDDMNDYLSEVKKEHGCSLLVRYSGIRGLPREKYVCPKSANSEFLKVYGKTGCQKCEYCAAIYHMDATVKEYSRYKPMEIHCSYPIITCEQVMNYHDDVMEYEAKEF